LENGKEKEINKMNKELRKRIWEEREKVQDLIDDVEVGEYIEERTFYRRLQSVDELLSDIIQDILMEDK
jgi:hypothetical protein